MGGAAVCFTEFVLNFRKRVSASIMWRPPSSTFPPEFLPERPHVGLGLHTWSHLTTFTPEPHPLSSHWSMEDSCSSWSSSQTASGKKMRVKDWTNRWRRTCRSAEVSSCRERDAHKLPLTFPRRAWTHRGGGGATDLCLQGQAAVEEDDGDGDVGDGDLWPQWTWQKQESRYYGNGSSKSQSSCILFMVKVFPVIFSLRLWRFQPNI